eukprot:scaffold297949_cov79-Cyclotella_meneghiniana.AAC.1
MAECFHQSARRLVIVWAQQRDLWFFVSIFNFQQGDHGARLPWQKWILLASQLLLGNPAFNCSSLTRPIHVESLLSRMTHLSLVLCAHY